MKSISEVLRELASSHDYRDKGADIYIVIDDHGRSEEPHVLTHSLSDELLARQSNEGATKHILHNGILSAISNWRDSRE